MVITFPCYGRSLPNNGRYLVVKNTTISGQTMYNVVQLWLGIDAWKDHTSKKHTEEIKAREVNEIYNQETSVKPNMKATMVWLNCTSLTS